MPVGLYSTCFTYSSCFLRNKVHTDVLASSEEQATFVVISFRVRVSD